jgi:ribulose-phosphate 3-epimerase
VRVTPAILANDLPSFTGLVKLAETFADYVQIDIMDGVFVPSTGISVAELAGVKTVLRSEAHLMVTKPEDWLEAVANFGSEEVIFHYEAVADPAATAALLHDTAFRAGLAVNPATPVAEFLSLADAVDTVMFMAVNPGFYGAPFISAVMDKIRELRAARPFLNIGVDGGINMETAFLAKDAGADFVCVGSAIFKAAEPAQVYCQMKVSLNPGKADRATRSDCD